MDKTIIAEGRTTNEAIENDDIDRMPPAVYAIAYIRKLCDYYNISGESAEKMICELRSELNRDVPDALISRVEIDTESTEENEREGWFDRDAAHWGSNTMKPDFTSKERRRK